jgi:aldose 1-epimerase
MSFAVHTRIQPDVMDLDATLYLLEGPGCRAEVWPAIGFNCIRWQVERSGQVLELLYTDPELFHNGRPTRSGIPVLFPFPNRIRGGRFRWDGKDYQLPVNDEAKKNANHGFALRHPWRVLGQGSDETGAWVTGAWQASKDAPEVLSLWPADHAIQMTYRLGSDRLHLDIEVHNPDRVPLPFGLGFHPYFRIPFAPSADAAHCKVSVPARAMWKLEHSLPTGEREPVPPSCDLNTLTDYRGLQLDNVLTDLPAAADMDGLQERAAVEGAPGVVVRMGCSPVFREMVVFTPPHRQAFCAEPYTCTTDAINLQQKGIDAGLIVLQPGQRWQAALELRVGS